MPHRQSKRWQGENEHETPTTVPSAAITVGLGQPRLPVMVPWPRIDVAVVASASASVRAQMTLSPRCSRTRAGLRVVRWTGHAVIIHTRTRDRQWTPADSLRGQFRPAKMPLWLAARKWGCLGVAPAPPNVFWDAVVVEFTSQAPSPVTPFPPFHTEPTTPQHPRGAGADGISAAIADPARDVMYHLQPRP